MYPTARRRFDFKSSLNNMKILITGITSFQNRGVEALVVPVIQQLLAVRDDLNIEIASCTPWYDSCRTHPFDASVRFVTDHFMSTGKWGLRPNQSRTASLTLRAKRKLQAKLGLKPTLPPQISPEKLLPYETPDLLMMSGGDLICSDYSTSALKHFLEPVHWAFAKGIPCALIGQSIGKFTSDEDIAIWKAAERKASLITVREPLTKRYLVEELGSNPDKIIETADCAFMLKPDKRLGENYKSMTGRPLIGISISESISKWTAADYDAHVDAWVNIAGRILEDWHAEIVIIPHVQDPKTDDRIVATRVWRKLGFDPRIQLCGGDLSASEFKGVLSACDMVIAERMHAAIGSLSCGVPTVPIGYSIKAEGIITQIYQGSEMNPLDSVIPLHEFLNLGESWIKLDNFWKNRGLYSRFLKVRLPEIVSASKKNVSLMCELLSHA